MQGLSKSIANAVPAWAARGFQIVYHGGEANHCPGCGRQHWIVGRVTAQCAFCETALPLENVSGLGFSPRIVSGRTAGELRVDLRPMI